MQLFKTYRSLHKTDHGLGASIESNWKFQVDILESWLVRVALIPVDGFTVDRTWMIAPEGETPWEGNHKLFIEGFSCPAFDFRTQAETVTLQTDLLQVQIQDDHLQLSVSQNHEERFVPALQDRKTGAYYLTNQGHAIRHYQANSEENRHFGLGDKTGPLDRSGRRFRILQMDSLGYNAETSDPLYKHIPFVIIQDSTTGCAIGLLYDCMSEMVFDLGCEHSNYHQQYRYVEAREKGLVYYVIGGPGVSDVVRKLTQLTGRPHLQPRWSMGFAFSSMHHADAPDAQKVITNFADQCRSQRIPISAIHFGSGYTTRGELRYVFTWNRDKFPDKEAMFSKFKKMGLHTVANTKPVLLTDHPAYQETAKADALIRRADFSPAVGVFWDADGSYLDFTSEAGIDWWQQGAQKAVLDAGFDAIWNDNNETEIWDESASINGFDSHLPAMNARPLQSLLMTRASFEVTIRNLPGLRPYTISRSGPIGIQRYAETWTGDNKTSWHTLKWNLCNGLSLGLSGIPCIGHDIGGFSGPKPGSELLIRWVQMMVLHPRCVMNSWKPQLEHPANLPWMHQKATDIIRKMLELRYRFLPYLYTLAYQAHLTGDPIIRPMFYDFDDPQCYLEQESFLLGKDVIVAPVVKPGKTSVSVYLPNNEYGWYDYNTGQWYEGGQTVELRAELNCLPLLVQAGTVLPLALKWEISNPHDAEVIELTAFSPPSSGKSRSTFFYDDGLTWNYQGNKQSEFTCEIKSNQQEVKLSVDHSRLEDDRLTLCTKFIGSNQRGTIVITVDRDP